MSVVSSSTADIVPQSHPERKFAAEHFTDTALSAYIAGEVAAQRNIEDGGASNFDCVRMDVGKEWELTKRILEHVGFTRISDGADGLRFMSPFGGQGEKNTQAVRAIAATFRKGGYNAVVLYKKD